MPTLPGMVSESASKEGTVLIWPKGKEVENVSYLIKNHSLKILLHRREASAEYNNPTKSFFNQNILLTCCQIFQMLLLICTFRTADKTWTYTELLQYITQHKLPRKTQWSWDEVSQ